jgi:hypothetical protein
MVSELAWWFRRSRSFEARLDQENANLAYDRPFFPLPSLLATNLYPART